MPWTDGYHFEEPMRDLRGDPRADVLTREVNREIRGRHPLGGRAWAVVAEAIPQDEVVITDGELVALVHLTWRGRKERPPWPQSHLIDSAAAYEVLIEFRY